MIAWWLAWVVQGVAVMLALHGVLRVVPRTNASTRCALWSVAIVSTVALGILGSLPAAESSVTSVGPLLLIPSPPDGLLAFAAISWAVVAALLLVRVISGVQRIQGIKRGCRPLPVELEDQLPHWLKARSRGRRPEVMISDNVPGAAVLGFRRPSIVLPPFLLRALSPEELDQVILHEYAHIRRWDDWSRLGQTIVESLVWMHPALRFAATRLNLEREVACDEWVVAQTGQPIAYARCLTRAAEARRTHIAAGSHAAFSAIGPALFGREHELRRRVDRLLARPTITQPAASGWRLATGACAVIMLTLSLRAIPVVAEIADIEWLPIPRAPLARFLPPPRADLRDTTVTPAGVAQRRAPVPQGVQTEMKTALPPEMEIGEDAPAPPVAVEAPVLTARSYDGAYTDFPHEAAMNEQGRWGAVAASIGTAGRKTGLGMAARFARAGGSVARRF